MTDFLNSLVELPLVEQLPQQLSSADVFLRLAHLPHVVFFDSAGQYGQLGRYSFVAADPFMWIACTDQADPLSELKKTHSQFPTTLKPDLPPFQGGWAGLLSYELCRSLEKLPVSKINDFPIPDLAGGFYDVVVAFDHQEEQSWIISQGFPELDQHSRLERARERLLSMKDWLATEPSSPHSPNPRVQPTSKMAPQYDVGLDDVTSNMSADSYRQMIQRAVEYIHAGDVFQVNLSQRLLCPARTDSVSLYLQLRETNPAPYAGYLDQGDRQVCSTSPECFLKLTGMEVETRPIKGTRGRQQNPEADLFVGDELLVSAKDRAENVMIVDLLRNDLSRVCEPESVQVSQLCQLEEYAFVKHLVSSIRGNLCNDVSAFDLLRASFPGGSITGAPKIRAMEIIADLEPTTRGAYCGSLAYIDFNGNMDSSILIRTITAGSGWWQLPVGGGIVAQSDPDDEYRETWHKARGLIAALKRT